MAGLPNVSHNAYVIFLKCTYEFSLSFWAFKGVIMKNLRLIFELLLFPFLFGLRYFKHLLLIPILLLPLSTSISMADDLCYETPYHESDGFLGFLFPRSVIPIRHTNNGTHLSNVAIEYAITGFSPAMGEKIGLDDYAKSKEKDNPDHACVESFMGHCNEWKDDSVYRADRESTFDPFGMEIFDDIPLDFWDHGITYNMGDMQDGDRHTTWTKKFIIFELMSAFFSNTRLYADYEKDNQHYHVILNPCDTTIPEVSIEDSNIFSSSLPHTIQFDVNITGEISGDIAEAYDYKSYIHYYTQDGSAKAGTDYEEQNGTITIVQGQHTADINITVKPCAEGDFYVILDNALGARINDGNATGTINKIILQFERPAYGISEDIDVTGTTKLVIPRPRIVLNQPANRDITVHYRTQDGTAKNADGDYIHVDRIVTIPEGNTSVEIPIEIWNDAPIELSEYFTVQLYDPNGACLGVQDTTQINIHEQEDSPVCFEDHFDNGLDSKWRVLRSRGGFTPEIVNVDGDNRLRITDTSKNLATTITKDFEFETSQNLIIVEFDYYNYGGCGGDHGGIGSYGADGIVNILFDSSTGPSPVPGGSGGSMGYAQYNGNTPGFEGGWLGLGIDEYGNFGNCNERRIGGLPDTSCDSGSGFSAQNHTNTAVIRGDGSGMSGYEFLKGVELSDIGQPSVAAKRSDKLDDYDSGRYKFTVDARDPAHLYLRLERDLRDGNGFQVILEQFDAKDSQYNQGTTPEKIRYAISSGTGGGCNNHELSWIRLKGNCAPYGLSVTGLFDAWDTFRHTTPTVPSDKNISTKIVNKPFNIQLVSYNEDKTGYETKISTVEAAIYHSGSTTNPISSNSVTFDIGTSDQQIANFTVDHADPSAFVGFKLCGRVDENDDYYLLSFETCAGLTTVYDCYSTVVRNSPVWRLCQSSDNFAIRPKKFNIANTPLIPAATIIAGIGYDINYTALDENNDPTLGYSQSENGSFEIVTALPDPTKTSCINQDINMTPDVVFHDGQYDGSQTYFGTIGDFNLSLNEVDGSEFAKIDADDTPFSNGTGSSEERFINPFVISSMHIVPSGYTITSVLSNAHVSPGTAFTYLNNISGTGDEAMAAKLNVTIQAIIADGTPAENYESSCYASQTTLEIDYNLSAIIPDGTLTKLLYKIPALTIDSHTLLSTPTSTPNNGTITESIPSAIFSDGSLGQATISLALNFDRTYNGKVNPFYMNIGDINLTETDAEVSSTAENTDANITYYFARLKPDETSYTNVKTNTKKTPLYINIYCGLATVAECNAFALNTGTIESDWFLSDTHSQNSGDGDITLRVDLPLIEGAGNPSIDGNIYPSAANIIILNANNGEKNATIASGVGASLPMTVGIEIVPSTDTLAPPYTDEWLIYNKDSNVIPKPLYKVRFIGAQADWSGVGSTGHAIDVNISEVESGRMNW